MKKMRKFLKKHKNLNIILSTVAVIWIWRGVWDLTDMIVFSEIDLSLVLGFGIPMLIGFAYLFLNDSKLTELLHSNEAEE